MMRLDRALVHAGLAGSRTRAARLIAEGRVTVDGNTVVKPSHPVGPDSVLAVSVQEPYVARSAYKLSGALQDLGVAGVVPGSRCLDAGASTGGFTQVLLEHGAAEVEAVDVGHGQLHPEISARREVVNRQGTTVRGLTAADIGGPVDLTVADLSFISLELVLPSLTACTRAGGTLLVMVKPQFELQRSDLDGRGVVTAPEDRARAVQRVLRAASRSGLSVLGAAASRLPGPSGNREYFVLCAKVEGAPHEDERLTVFVEALARGAAEPPPVRPDPQPSKEMR